MPMVKLKLTKEGKSPRSTELPGAVETSQPWPVHRALLSGGSFPLWFQGAPPSLSESLLLGKPVDSRGIPSFLRLAPPKAGPTFSPQDKSQENTIVIVTILVSLAPCMDCVHPQKNPVK